MAPRDILALESHKQVSAPLVNKKDNESERHFYVLLELTHQLLTNIE